MADRDYEDAVKVYTFLPKSDSDPPITGDELSSYARLTINRVRKAIGYLREDGVLPDDVPLVSSPRGYRLTFSAEQVMAFHLWRIRCATTVVRRLYHGVIKRYLPKVADPTTSRSIMRTFERLIEDLESVAGMRL